MHDELMSRLQDTLTHTTLICFRYETAILPTWTITKRGNFTEVDSTFS